MHTLKEDLFVSTCSYVHIDHSSVIQKIHSDVQQ